MAILVEDIMTRGVITVSPDDPVARAVSIMFDKNIGALPVIERDGRIVGIVCEGDLAVRVEDLSSPFALPTIDGWVHLGKARKVANRMRKAFGRTVGEVMTKEIVTVSPETPVAEAARLMVEERIRHLPVVSEGNLVGIIGERDLLKVLFKKKGG